MHASQGWRGSMCHLMTLDSLRVLSRTSMEVSPWTSNRRMELRTWHFLPAAFGCRLSTSKGAQKATFHPWPACIGLRTVIGLSFPGDKLAPFAALSRLEHLDCSQSYGLSDISALAACTALKYLDCSWTGIQQLPTLPASLETLICSYTPLSDISSLAACTSLKHLDCSGCRVITILPALPAGLETLNINGTQCVDLSALAACAWLHRLDCVVSSVRNLRPLLACKRLEFLGCDDFEGVDDQASMLILACPGLDIPIFGGGNGDEEDTENAEEGEGDGDEMRMMGMAMETALTTGTQ